VFSCTLSSLQFIMFMKKDHFFNVMNRSPTSQSCNQHISSPTSVINIDVAFKVPGDKDVCDSCWQIMSLKYLSTVSPTFQSCDQQQLASIHLTPDDLERIYENVNGKFLSLNTRNQMVKPCTKSVTRFINNWWLMIMFKIAQSVFKMIQNDKIADETVSTRF